MRKTKSKMPMMKKFGRMRSWGKLAPEFSFALDGGKQSTDDFYRSLPFNRSLILILISAVFLFVFSLPLLSMGVMSAGGDDDSLFSLIFMVFSLLWMLGWSCGVALLLIVFLGLILGRETVRVTENKLVLRIGIPGLGFGVSYANELIRNFRYQDGEVSNENKWRGQHLMFDYGDETIRFGSSIGKQEAEKIIAQLQALFPRHAAAPVDLSSMTAAATAAELEKVDAMEVEQRSAVEIGEPASLVSVSSIALIIANLIPLFGVILGGWEIGEIMLLFWAESAVIGLYNLCKMWRIGHCSVLFYGTFFVAHYGAFMSVHLLFIYVLFGGELVGEGDVSQLQVWVDLQKLWPALLALVVSHGISYFVNFLSRKEYENRSMSQQMKEPYRRVVIMHLTIIFGGFLTLSLGSSLAALVLLLVLKIFADLRSHLLQHTNSPV